MPGENLTRVEAHERSSLITVHSYKVELDLSGTEDTFWSGTDVHFSANRAGSSTFIDAITAKVHRVVLNGQELDVNKVNDGVRIQLNHLQEENHLRVESEAIYMNTGEGLHRFIDPADGQTYLYSQFEVPDSRRVFAVFEQPDLKATFEFVVTAPEAWKVISNQPAASVSNVGSKKNKWVFEPTPRISSYITALVAGPYHEVRSELVNTAGRTIPLGVFCRQSMAQYLEADYMFEKTRQGFEFFETQFGVEYPFAKYDQLFVPEFNAGAMENAGAVTFTERYVFRSQPADALRERRVITVLHELAHMWFGDLVTMKWWNDLWLNESFAEYAAELAVAEATEWTNVWATFCSKEKSWAYRQDQLPSTHPIVAPINDLHDVQVNFDGITYAKGASALKQLVAFVGQEPFMRGLGQYFRKHAYQNTELNDLLVELEDASGRDLTNWSKLWLETAGVNTLAPALTVDSEGTILGFAITQSAAPDYPTIRPHSLRVGFYDWQDGQLVRTHQVATEIDSTLAQVPELVGLKRPALILLNDDDLTYAKIRFDAQSWQVALASLSKVTDPLARAQIWLSIWNAARDGVVAPRKFIDAVLDHIATEDQSMLVSTMLGYLYSFTFQYTARSKRANTIDAVADKLWQLLNQAAPASDMQLQLMQYYPKFARTVNHQENLRGILDGKLILAGLDLGSDLRWHLLIGLASGGNLTVAQIDEELAKDNTANGLAASAAAKAASSDPVAKAESWETMLDTEEYSNAQCASASLDFGRALTLQPLEPYVERYFADAQKIWETKTYKIAEYLLERLYPINLANKELAVATKRYLERHPKMDRAMRRMIVENLSTLERALAAQALDAEDQR